MAYAFNSDGSGYVAVPVLSGNNTFTGIQTFSGTTNSTSVDTGTVIIKGGLGVQGNLYASQVWGCVWNDLTDCLEVPRDTDLEYGYCYCFDGEKYFKSRSYLDDGVVGIHSDTSGFTMGVKPNKKVIKVAVAGFVLAYVDKEYPVGTPLVCGENGYLTKLREEDISTNLHKIVGTFWKAESSDKWGAEGEEVLVNGRMWVKVK